MQIYLDGRKMTYYIIVCALRNDIMHRKIFTIFQIFLEINPDLSDFMDGGNLDCSGETENKVLTFP